MTSPKVQEQRFCMPLTGGPKLFLPTCGHKHLGMQQMHEMLCHTTTKRHQLSQFLHEQHDRIPSTTPGEEPPRDAKDSGSARSHSTHLETSSSNRP